MSQCLSCPNSFRYSVWIIGGLCWLSGCTSGPALEELAAFLREQQREIHSPIELDKVEITKSEQSGEPPIWKLEVKITGKSKVDQFDPITLEDAYSHYKHNPQSYDEAIQRASLLRNPERSEAIAKRPDALRVTALFRKTLSAGDTFTFTTNVSAEKKQSKWAFYGDPESIRIEGATFQTTARGELPKHAVILDGDQENSLTKWIHDQDKFVEAVETAEKSMTERLARERRQLLDASRVGRAWVGSWPNRNGPPTNLRAQFLPQPDSEKILVLLSNPEQFSKRSVWTGKLDLLPAPSAKEVRIGIRPNPDGWFINLTPAVKDETLPLTENQYQIKFVAMEDGTLRWDLPNSPITFTEDTQAPKLPTYETLVQEFQTGTAPGQVWEGTLQYDGLVTQRVRMIFTERRNEGRYLRAVVELADDPFVIAVFEGTVTTSIEAVYGSPIRLHRKYGMGPGTFVVNAIPLFRQNYTGANRLNLTGSLDEGRDLQGGGLQLKRVQPLNGTEPHRERWKAALEPGACWSGTMAFANEPVSRIKFTVAEVRDDAKYVRLTAENPDSRNCFRVFEGTLDSSDSAVDGYALTVTGMFPTPLPTRHDSGGHADIFGLLKAPQQLRLLPDGNTLICMSRAGQLERVILKREEHPALLSLKRDEIAKVWRQRCVKGSRWRGSLTNLAVKQTIDVELAILSDVDGLGNLIATIGVPREPKTTINFTGTLRLDSDISANGYALDLTKQTTGPVNSKSPILGNTSNRNHVQFRLGPNGTELIGYAHGGPGTDGPEVLELKLVEGVDDELPAKKGAGKPNSSIRKK